MTTWPMPETTLLNETERRHRAEGFEYRRAIAGGRPLRRSLRNYCPPLPPELRAGWERFVEYGWEPPFWIN